MLNQEPSLNNLFPKSARLLLTGGGKEFIERVGIEASRQIILGIMMGENIRTQTEPLSRRRIDLLGNKSKVQSRFYSSIHF